uniref:Uncharacterized protein n=1 Tax=Kalanchoe fedtschenkoi TaxID=63787 RepID=A0A7N0T5S5_KALFE
MRFVAFFTACNRHRLSIYNHAQDFIQRVLGSPQMPEGPTTRTRRRINEDHHAYTRRT